MEITALYTLLQPAKALQNPGFLLGPGIDYITLIITVLAVYVFRQLIHSISRHLT